MSARIATEENLAVHEELVEAVISGNPKSLSKAIERHTPMADRLIYAES